MPKALTISGMVISVLIMILFILDLSLKLPFQRASMMMDIVFLVSAAILGFLSWSSYRELK